MYFYFRILPLSQKLFSNRNIILYCVHDLCCCPLVLVVARHAPGMQCASNSPQTALQSYTINLQDILILGKIDLGILIKRCFVPYGQFFTLVNTLSFEVSKNLL